MKDYFIVTDLEDAIRQLCELHKQNFALKQENEKLKQELDKAEFALQERIASAFLEKAIGKLVEKVIAEQSKPGGLLYK